MDRTICKEKTSIYIIDQNHKIVYYNSALQEIFPELQCGAYCYEVLCHEEQPCEECPLQNEQEGSSVFYNKWIQRWINVNTGEVNWPGAGICAVVMASGIYGDNRNLFCNLTNLSIYDELLEINLTEDTYRVLYHADRVYDIPALKGSFGEMIQNLADQTIHPDDRMSFLEFWDLNSLIPKLNGTVSAEIVHSEFRQKQENGDWCWM